MPSLSIDTKLTDFPSDIARIARETENTAVDVWINETGHDPFLSAAVLAELTETITIGTRIATAFTRSPMSLAYTAWDLADHSNGRFTLGLGTQVRAHNVRRFSVDFEWDSPGPRLREVIQALRHIWRAFQHEDEDLAFEGEYYSFSLLSDYFDPGPIDHPDIPIHIAGLNEYNVRLAGELCDGLALHPFNSPSFIEEVIHDWVGSGAARADRSQDAVDLTAGPFVITGRSDEALDERREYVRRRIAFYASTPAYRLVLDHHGWGDLQEDLYPLSLDQRWDEMAEYITDEILYTFAVEAPHDSLAEALRDRYAGIVDRVVIEDGLAVSAPG